MKKQRSAHALHRRAGRSHTVIMNLHVLVSQDGDGLWNAQGIEVDYAACGSTLEDVQGRFQKGLRRTIQAHLERYGSIEKILTRTPTSIVEEIKDGNEYSFTLSGKHDLKEPLFPYKNIEYMRARP